MLILTVTLRIFYNRRLWPIRWMPWWQEGRLLAFRLTLIFAIQFLSSLGIGCSCGLFSLGRGQISVPYNT